MHAAKRRCVICHTSYVQGESFCPRDGGAVVADAGTTTDDLVGTTIDGRYLVTRLLGRGGMGKVYEADHVGLGKRVAIKFVSDADADREQRARFRQEARAASRIVHENVIQIFDVGTDAGRDYIVMEYVEGRDLDEVIRDGVLSAARAIAIAQQMLRGLHACHAAGILHRDIKPSNIRLTNDQDFVKIMDFGISKSTHANVAQTDTGTGRVIGTPEFMAPEQILDREVDHRADIFAAGATLFTMLAGKPPFGGTGFTQRVKAMQTPPPAIDEVRAGLPASLVTAIDRAMSPDPADRFSDALAFADALRDSAAIVESRGEAATKPATRPSKPGGMTALAPTAAAPIAIRRRRVWPFAIGLLAVIAGVATALIVTRSREHPRLQPVTVDAATIVDAAVAIPEPIDAAVTVAPIDAPAKKQPPRDLPVGTVVAAEPKGKPCRCEYKTATGVIGIACTKKRAELRCRCKSDRTTYDLCPFVITVTEGTPSGIVRRPDGASSGKMNCVDRTRLECDPTKDDMPASCVATYRVAAEGAACTGYVPGLTEGDSPLAGTYRCSICDLSPDRPKFYGKTGDQCVGYADLGDKVTGTLQCYD